MSVASSKHYLNTNLKPVEGDKFPVYVRVIHKRNPQRFVSVLLDGVYLSEKEFNNSEIIKHITQKESDIILYIYDLLQEKIKNFDIRNYKGKSIRTMLVRFTDAFADYYTEKIDLQTIKWESVSNFFNYINELIFKLKICMLFSILCIRFM